MPKYINVHDFLEEPDWLSMGCSLLFVEQLIDICTNYPFLREEFVSLLKKYEQNGFSVL